LRRFSASAKIPFLNELPVDAMIAVAAKTVHRLYMRASVQQNDYKVAETVGAFTLSKVPYHFVFVSIPLAV
jgi:hypothetical protein